VKGSTRVSRNYTKSFLPSPGGSFEFPRIWVLIPGCITWVELSFSKRSRFLLLSSVESVNGWGFGSQLVFCSYKYHSLEILRDLPWPPYIYICGTIGRLERCL
jgi:hypothetical protein